MDFVEQRDIVIRWYEFVGWCKVNNKQKLKGSELKCDKVTILNDLMTIQLIRKLIVCLNYDKLRLLCLSLSAEGLVLNKRIKEKKIKELLILIKQKSYITFRATIFMDRMRDGCPIVNQRMTHNSFEQDNCVLISFRLNF